MIQQVVGEGRGGAAVGATGDVAPTVVATCIDLPCFAGAGGTGAVEAGQFVWLAIAVEILLLRTSAIERPLPQLAQVGIDVRVAVAGPAQAVGEGCRATGAVACPWLGAGVACPHQAVLLIVAEVLALTAA
ncbi:MAG TPA: hypothetical protein VIX20_01290 [Ktedonobacteraceae bacterium]